MIEAKIQYDQKQLRAIFDQLKHIPRGFPTVISRAVNKTLGHVRSVIVKEATKRINEGRKGKTRLRQKDIKSRVRYIRANRKDFAGYVQLMGKGLSLALYSAEQTAEGVEYYDANKKLIKLKSSFIPTLKSKYQGVFMRENKSRLPILEQYGDSIADIWRGAPDFANETLSDANKAFKINLDTQIKLVLDKYKNKKSKK